MPRPLSGSNPFKITSPEARELHEKNEDLTTSQPAPPSLWGIPLKYISLVTLAVQNSLLTIIMHYSRVSIPASRTYSAATAVLMNEILKGSISLVIAFSRVDSGISSTSLDGPREGSCRRTVFAKVKKLGRDVFSADCWKLSIPAILYVIQNNLQYVAASNLDAATFQVSYQMKILTTAAFSVLLLRKKLTSIQWVSLLFLAIGVGIVQIQSGAAQHHSSPDAHTMNAMQGFIAVAAACFTSGLAGVYFEMVLKNSQGDLWVRNVQLSLFSLLPCIVHILFSHETQPVAFGSPGWVRGLFANFGLWAWGTVLVQVIGGLVTAMVIKYSDNIMKGFATSLSIVMSFLASVALFDFRMTWTFVIGSAIVLNATWMYNQPAKRVGLMTGRDIKGWGAAMWSEKWKGETPCRSPNVTPVYGDGVVSSTGSLSRTSSYISLASLSSTNTSPTSEEKHMLR
ncbi:hypothetical protein PM082_013164 [Marasmius tenuissimus]|nr:hypothetical protein PM082_013164 [Marasmius tenuissimus]